MTVTKEDARQEAERRYPELNPGDAELTYPREAIREIARKAFERGAVWASEQADHVERIARILAQASTFTGQDALLLVKTAQKIAEVEQADRGCGHPNHEAEDHDCAPFLPNREPSERLMVAPAIQAVRDVLDGLEDWEIEGRAREEIRSAVDDIPDCESATAIPHEEHGEPSDATLKESAPDLTRPGDMRSDLAYPSDAEVLAAANVYMEYEPPYKALDEFSPEFLVDIRAALLAAQEVRNRG